VLPYDIRDYYCIDADVVGHQYVRVPREVIVDFKVFTNALKAYEGPNGDLFVTGTTSSTIRDLHGDEMTLNAIETMANTAKQNMTIFLNHNYNVPQDLFGSVKDARVVKRYDVESNSEVYDLDIDVLVCKEDENPEAMRAFKAIKRGVKLGLSIGARVDRVSKKKDARTGDDTYVIDAVKLMEASVVGIPANQRSYLQNALKSLKAAEQSGELVVNHKAATDLSEGDFVSWGSSGGTARGRIEHVMREGTLGVPDSDFKIEATPEDPAALIRIWSRSNDEWAETDKLVGHKCSTLRKIDSLKGIFDLEESTEIDSSPAVSIDAAGIVDGYEQKGDVDSSANSLLAEGEIIVGDAEKATRVTVTVTQSDDKETKKPEASENIQDEAVSAASDVSKSEQESPVEAETAVDVAPEADPAVEAPVEVPVEAPVDEPVEAPVEEPVVEEVNAAHEALQALGAVLVRASAGERAHILSKVAEFADGETATVAEAEVAEAVVTEGEPVADEAQEVAQEIVEANGLDEVTAIAKSALDAAFAAQQEVSLIKSQLTELIAQKAKVESDLAKALDVVGRLMDLPSGRKAYSSASNSSGTKAPWLSPVIQRMLDSQE
jgi:HK97 family phage prohead protease